MLRAYYNENFKRDRLELVKKMKYHHKRPKRGGGNQGKDEDKESEEEGEDNDNDSDKEGEEEGEDKEKEGEEEREAEEEAPASPTEQKRGPKTVPRKAQAAGKSPQGHKPSPQRVLPRNLLLVPKEPPPCKSPAPS